VAVVDVSYHSGYPCRRITHAMCRMISEFSSCRAAAGPNQYTLRSLFGSISERNREINCFFLSALGFFVSRYLFWHKRQLLLTTPPQLIVIDAAVHACCITSAPCKVKRLIDKLFRESYKHQCHGEGWINRSLYSSTNIMSFGSYAAIWFLNFITI
jgi:hypothetical protein